MTGNSAEMVVVLILGLTLLGLIGSAIALAPLKPAVVQRFEQRQSLQVTTSNAAHVLSALTITHRWRRFGVVIGLGIGLLWSLKDGALTINFLTGFLGWFVGLVIAQWRIGLLDEPGERRAASLAARGVTTYVTRTNLALLGIAVAAWAVLAVTSALRSGVTWAWALQLLYSVVMLGAVALTARAIVNRPSGFVDHDVREADDALRGHGMTVLVGSTIALLYPPLWEFAIDTAYPVGVPYSMDPTWVLLIFVVCVAVGWWVAAVSRSVRAGRKPSAAGVGAIA